ncbi:MAG: hypothetical protein QF886_17345, partial [Planctomycetota bacterium]|nr:hypothetical protein [Planctomycetota bacterium]
RMTFYRNSYRRLRYVGSSYVCGQGAFYLNGVFAFDIRSGGDIMPFPPEIQMKWDGRISEPPKTYVLTDDTIYATGPVTMQRACGQYRKRLVRLCTEAERKQFPSGRSIPAGQPSFATPAETSLVLLRRVAAFTLALRTR